MKTSEKEGFFSCCRQDATFYFLNVAPQWKKFNSGNWLAVELKVRSFAEKNQKDLNIYTGTHKVRIDCTYIIK